ncbi:MAG: hypothetical protein ACKVP4_06365 [Hyphomicrobium sp.]
MRRFKAIGAMAAALAVAIAASPAAAAIDWDRAANIKDAATRLVQMHRRQGSPGVLKFLDACYRTHMLANEFGAGLEACLAQDYMHSNVLVQIYARVPPEQRAKNKNPSAGDIAKSLGERFVVAFAQYKMTSDDVAAFKKLVDKYGLPIFLKGVFPNAAGPTITPEDPRDKKN